MPAGPAGQAPERGGLRAGHADRERVIGALKAAFVEGRLTKEEFDLRVEQTLASRTYADLARLTDDLPPADPPLAAAGPRPTAPAARRPARGFGPARLLPALALGAVALSAAGGGPLTVLAVFGILIIVCAALCVLLVGGLVRLHSWLRRRAGMRE